MDGFCGPDILKLAELLTPAGEEDNFDDEQKVKPYSKIAPADLIKPKIVKASDDDETDDNEAKLESVLAENSAASNDWRLSPQWDIAYKQSVSPSDVFLQMSGKTQLTASCEEMIITIHLPGEKAANIDVKILKDHLDVISPQFKLSAPLPQPVDPHKGSAKFDPDTEKLMLTLVMNREFDYVNF